MEIRNNTLIRTIEKRDLKEIDIIYNEAIRMEMATADTEPYNRQKRQEWFEDHPEHSYPVYLAEFDNKVMGYIYFSPYRKGRKALDSVAEISYFIAEEYRGQGLGSVLMEYALSKAPGLGFKNLIAILMEHNAASIALLEKFGFELWGKMPRIAEFNGKRYDHLYYGKSPGL